MAKLWKMTPQEYNLIWTELILKEQRIAKANRKTVPFTDEELKVLRKKYYTSFGERQLPTALHLEEKKREYDLCHHMRDKYVLRPKLKRDDRSDSLVFGRSGRDEEKLRIVPVTSNMVYGFRQRYDPHDNKYARCFNLKEVIYKKHGTGLPPMPGDLTNPVFARAVFEPQMPTLYQELMPKGDKKRLDAMYFKPLIDG